MTGIFWVILSYILGSFPTGYLISRFSGKNVLKIGWRKTSGSNVFRNVGKWQGILTGIVDVAKGFLAVWGAQRLGLPNEIQVFSGVAAVVGHNWSFFLRFAGGRGIGTFVGAFLAFSPPLLLFCLIPALPLAFIWNAAVATLLFLATAVFLSWWLGQFETVGTFTLLSLVPIFIKRLSPVGEIKKTKQRFSLVRNRLAFDNDQALMGLRIKRIFKKIKEDPDRLTKAVKPITLSFWLSSKLGWRAAKFGIEMAKKPIEKLILRSQERVVTEINTEEFKKMMMAAAKKIVLHQEEINRINVFPVADKDTGYNLAATLLGVEGTISSKNYSTFRELTEDIKEAAMINARGNAGMIYTGYLIEVLDRIKHLKKIDAFHLALAMKRGIKASRLSIANPVEGTILDVIKTAGNGSFVTAKGKKEKNIIKVLEEANKVSQVALKETKEKLAVLKENDVVDAGALGFVKTLEAWIEELKGVAPEKEAEDTTAVPQSHPKGFLEYRYEVVASFKKEKQFSLEDFKEELFLLGDSLELLESKGKVKFHIHTNSPREVVKRIKDYSKSEFRVEDMEKQIKRAKKESLGLVVDEIADLPKEFLEKHKIEEVPFTSKFPDGEIISSKKEIFSKMKEALAAGRSLPTTSAPSFKEYLSAYQRALKNFKKILVITASSKLTGAYSSARIARSTYKKPAKLNIFVFDCFSGEVAEGLVCIKAQELISQGKKTEEIVEILKKFCPKVNLLFCIDDFRYVTKGGRVKLPKILIKPVSLIQRIGVRPLIVLKNGKVRFSGVRFGRDIPKILSEEVEKQRRGKKIRVAIAHANNLKEATKLKKKLEKKSGIEVLFVSSVSAVVGTHTGSGVLLVAFHPVDN
jgi:acyl-phosphate glycerol 3-phosphate acyltransferase